MFLFLHPWGICAHQQRQRYHVSSLFAVTLGFISEVYLPLVLSAEHLMPKSPKMLQGSFFPFSSWNFLQRKLPLPKGACQQLMGFSAQREVCAAALEPELLMPFPSTLCRLHTKPIVTDCKGFSTKLPSFLPSVEKLAIFLSPRIPVNTPAVPTQTPSWIL